MKNNKELADDEKNFLTEFCCSNKDLTLYKKMFVEPNYNGGYQLHERRRVVEDREYSPDECTFSKKRYIRHEKTIKQNMEIMEGIFSLLNENYPGIRIILLHLPVFYQAQRIIEPYVSQWKEEFNNILDNFRTKYDFEYYDLKNYEPIGKNCKFFYDVGHLNTTGAVAMTSYLEKLLFATEQ